MKVRQRTMWPRVWGMIGCGGVGLLLLAGMAGAQPFPGGLPRCLASLKTCHADLGMCQIDLAACLAEPTVVFPGDGAGHGATLRYTDNMDGTATDNNTLLMWEVKNDVGGVHDVDNRYTWTSSGTAADGTLFTVFLDTLNNKCDGDEVTACTSDADCLGIGNGKCGHAGFRDWRIPHIKELQSIVDYGQVQPAMDPTFPGLTTAFDYWSSTENVGIPETAWNVAFNYGYVFDVGKFDALRGRAVRPVIDPDLYAFAATETRGTYDVSLCLDRQDTQESKSQCGDTLTGLGQKLMQSFEHPVAWWYGCVQVFLTSRSSSRELYASTCVGIFVSGSCPSSRYPE